MIRGVDTQIVATKPMDQVANQQRMQKQDELHMQQNAARLNQQVELDQQRTVAATGAEGQRIEADREREREEQERKKKQQNRDGDPQKPERIDPLLMLPVEKGRYAKRETHIIDYEL